MNVEISKTELAGALSALGKLVCRTAPREAYRSMRIEGKENQISFQTIGAEQSITCTFPAEGVEAFAVIVNFDDFRTVARYSRNKTLVLEYDSGRFSVDRTPLTVAQIEWPQELREAGRSEVTDLPANFIDALAAAAPIVNRNEPRRALQGIHLCREGIVVTNGRELFHIDMPLAVEKLTIPFPHAPLATKSEDAGRLTTWCEREYRYFRFDFGMWRWTGKAIVGTYPAWQKVIPETDSMKCVVQLDTDHAEQLAAFLRNVPAEPPNHPVTLAMSENHASLNIEAGSMRTGFAAEFPVDWGGFRITVNREILLRLLHQGHRRLAFGEAHGPFIATGGIGRYIAMPLGCSEKKPETQTVQPKEEKMNEMQTPVVAAPVAQPVAQTINPEPAVVNPLDDLAAAVDEFKARIRAMFDESTLLSRKVKEVALVQKQKERDFVQAKRVLERIRMAI